MVYSGRYYSKQPRKGSRKKLNHCQFTNGGSGRFFDFMYWREDSPRKGRESKYTGHRFKLWMAFGRVTVKVLIK